MLLVARKGLGPWASAEARHEREVVMGNRQTRVPWAAGELTLADSVKGQKKEEASATLTG